MNNYLRSFCLSLVDIVLRKANSSSGEGSWVELAGFYVIKKYRVIIHTSINSRLSY